MLENLNFISLNVNGLRDPLKRSNLFLWLKSLKLQLIFLQDVRFLPSDATLWTQQWGRPVIWSRHNAILLTDLSYSLTLISVSTMPSRVLLVKICIPNIVSSICIGSIYIPATRLARSEFLCSLPEDLGFELSILSGDCNIVPNYTLDHFPYKQRPPPSHWNQFAGVVQGWGLVDLYYFLSPVEPQMTHWQQTAGGRVGTRINYILVNQSQTPLFTLPRTQVCVYSDHYGLVSSMKLATTAKHGPGYWKLNASLLGYHEYQEGIKAIWYPLVAQLKLSQWHDVQGVWEEAKSLFQAYSVFYASVQAKQRSSSIANFERSISQLDASIIAGGSSVHVLLAKRSQLSQGLRALLDYRFEGQRVRSRVKWFEVGEKSSKYFHTLVAACRLSSSISKLQTDWGLVVTGIKNVVYEA